MTTAKPAKAARPGKTERAAKVKSFNLHWGSGVVAEEAQAADEYKTATIQLLEFLEGEAKGRTQIRFCYYSPSGAFQRFPLILDSADIPANAQGGARLPEASQVAVAAGMKVRATRRERHEVGVAYAARDPVDRVWSGGAN